MKMRLYQIGIYGHQVLNGRNTKRINLTKRSLCRPRYYWVMWCEREECSMGSMLLVERLQGKNIGQDLISHMDCFLKEQSVTMWQFEVWCIYKIVINVKDLWTRVILSKFYRCSVYLVDLDRWRHWITLPTETNEQNLRDENRNRSRISAVGLTTRTVYETIWSLVSCFEWEEVRYQ